MRGSSSDSLLADGEQLGAAFRQYEQRTVGGDGCRSYLAAHVQVFRVRLLLAVLEDQHIAIVGANIDLAVHPVRRTPNGVLGVVVPVFFACTGINTVDVAIQVGGIEKSVMDG